MYAKIYMKVDKFTIFDPNLIQFIFPTFDPNLIQNQFFYQMGGSNFYNFPVYGMGLFTLNF
jgi:hypothetical protein